MSYEDLTMVDAEKTGDRKTILLVLRRILAESLDNALDAGDSRTIPSIAARLQDVTNELENMGEGSKPDETMDSYTDAYNS